MAQNEWESFKGFSTRKRVKRENRSDFYHIQDTNNQLHLVWGCATLDREMERVKVGDTDLPEFPSRGFAHLVFLHWKR